MLDPSAAATRTSAWRAFLLVAVAAVAALGGPAAADDAFYGEQDVALGDSVACTLAARESHLFSFYAVAGTRVDATLRPGLGSVLLPSLRLVRPGGEPVVTGRALRRRGATSRLRAFAVPYSGWFVLEVASLQGAGSYELATARARPARRTRVVPGAKGDQEYRFDAVAGSEITLDLVPRGRLSRARPSVVELRDPLGAPVAADTEPRGAGVRLLRAFAPDDGEHTLLWRNDGPAGDVVVRITLRGPDGARFRRILPASSGIPTGIADKGAPRDPPRDGYLGSAACGRCHDEIWREWSQTAHHLAARPWNQPGMAGAPVVADSNGNGRDDFRDGLDLAGKPGFAALGANAPKLSYVAGADLPYRITVGAATWEVERTMGGNGLWRQQYLVRAGAHLVPAPVAYEEATRTWTLEEPSTWYDDETNLPLHASAATVPADRSFEARCSGCHNTGETIRFDAASSAYVTGYAEFGIGCEQCHGPGREHVRHRGDTTKILNPRKLVDGTEAGLRRANDVCGRCHTRGDSVDAIAGTGTRAEFPYRAGSGIAQAGDDLSQFLRTTTSPDDFWGRKTEPFPALPGDTFVGARTSRQQGTEFAAGAHAPDEEADEPSCFDCHDPHSRRNEHMIVASMRVADLGVGSHTPATELPGTYIATKPDDGSLCLACHAGADEGPFTDLSRADVATIASGAPSAGVVQAVLRHMADSGMHVEASDYDPEGTGVGNCVSCHMPLLASSGPFGADPAGYRRGDLHSHTFRPVPASASRLHTSDGAGVTNSCTSCHPTGVDDEAAEALEAWSEDGPDDDGVFHARTPTADMRGAVNAANDGGVPCVACHTTEGFVLANVGGGTLPQSEIDTILKESIAVEKGVACDACHGPRADGSLSLTDRQPLRLPKTELCGACHNARTVTFADFLARGEELDHPTREMFDGTAGADVPPAAIPGYKPDESTFHSGLEDGCVTCHLNREYADHSHAFAAQVTTCGTCHQGLATFDRPSKSDWDGDGDLEGVQSEVTGLLDLLREAILGADGLIGFEDGTFQRAGAAPGALTGATEAVQRAAFNWYAVDRDRSRGVHNAARAIQLLQRSYREVTGTDVPGAALR